MAGFVSDFVNFSWKFMMSQLFSFICETHFRNPWKIRLISKSNDLNFHKNENEKNRKVYSPYHLSVGSKVFIPLRYKNEKNEKNCRKFSPLLSKIESIITFESAACHARYKQFFFSTRHFAKLNVSQVSAACWAAQWQCCCKILKIDFHFREI